MSSGPPAAPVVLAFVGALAAVWIASCAGGGVRITHVETRLRTAVVTNASRAGRSIETRLQELAVPGVVIGVVNDHRLQWVKAYGMADRERAIRLEASTPLQFASIAKPLTALATALLAADGRVALRPGEPLPPRVASRGQPGSARERGDTRAVAQSYRGDLQSRCWRVRR